MHKQKGELDTSKQVEMKKRTKGKTTNVDSLLVCKSALEDIKAQNIKEISLVGKGAYTDNLLIATGTSSSHVQSIADKVCTYLSKAGLVIDGIEGTPNNQWVIVDAGDIVVHVFLEETRELYNIEKLYMHDFDDDDDSETSEPAGTLQA